MREQLELKLLLEQLHFLVFFERVVLLNFSKFSFLSFLSNDVWASRNSVQISVSIIAMAALVNATKL